MRARSADRASFGDVAHAVMTMTGRRPSSE